MIVLSSSDGHSSARQTTQEFMLQQTSLTMTCMAQKLAVWYVYCFQYLSSGTWSGERQCNIISEIEGGGGYCREWFVSICERKREERRWFIAHVKLLLSFAGHAGGWREKGAIWVWVVIVYNRCDHRFTGKIIKQEGVSTGGRSIRS